MAFPKVKAWAKRESPEHLAAFGEYSAEAKRAADATRSALDPTNRRADKDKARAIQLQQSAAALADKLGDATMAAQHRRKLAELKG